MTATIYALSSGALPAGIAVVRVSGPGAFAALRGLTVRVPTSRVATLCRLADAAGPIDEALVLVFPAPASATGEDVVEFHLHGGVAVVAALFAALDGHGLRIATPGEFTRRAFDNGRLDLSQVEGLADLIAAETAGQHRAAAAQAGGALRTAVEAWRGRLIDLLADAEAGLDFSDSDEIEDLDARPAILALATEIERQLGRAGAARALRDGLTIVVSGPPNVGKSSLVNRLSGRDAAIVSPLPGTTRDAIEVRLDLGGVLVTLVDTAGLRDACDEIEVLGISRARARAAAADLVLALYDGSDPPAAGLAVRTKADLSEATTGLAVSSVTGAGIDALLVTLADWARTTATSSEPGLLTQARHVEACRAAHRELHEAAKQPDPVLRAENLRLALRSLGTITGIVGVEQLLDAVFARFCIGK